MFVFLSRFYGYQDGEWMNEWVLLEWMPDTGRDELRRGKPGWGGRLPQRDIRRRNGFWFFIVLNLKTKKNRTTEKRHRKWRKNERRRTKKKKKRRNSTRIPPNISPFFSRDIRLEIFLATVFSWLFFLLDEFSPSSLFFAASAVVVLVVVVILCLFLGLSFFGEAWN